VAGGRIDHQGGVDEEAPAAAVADRPQAGRPAVGGEVQLGRVVDDELGVAGLSVAAGRFAVRRDDGLEGDLGAVEQPVGRLEVGPGFGLVGGGAVRPGGDLLGEVDQAVIASPIAEVTVGEGALRASEKIGCVEC
jgi:hypothetical protein